MDSEAGGALNYAGKVSANREMDPSCSDKPARNTHQTHPGASKVTARPSIRTRTDDGNASRNQNNTRTSIGPERPPSRLVKKGLRNLPQRGSLVPNKVKEFGDRVLEPIINTLGIEPGLRTCIRNATVRSSYPGYDRDRFLPKDELTELLTHQSVEKALTKCQKYRKYSSIRSLRDSKPNLQLEIESICNSPIGDEDQNSTTKSYRKIFIILVLLKKASLISCFIDGEVCDDDLPIRLYRESVPLKWICLRKGGQELPPQGFQDLSQKFFIDFIEKQWIVLAPYFSPYDELRDNPQNLLEEQIPPFTFWKPLPKESQGGGGEVYKACIHPSQHGLSHPSISKTSQMVFAVKCVETSQGKREHSILKRFKNNRHKHLVSILTAYIQNGKYHHIFPFAQGDLHSYWKHIHREPSSTESEDDLVWLAEQCQGLAEGLAFIHRYQTASFESLLHPHSNSKSPIECSQGKLRLFGRHGDIKPENILYFPRWEKDLRGVLVITDFGCTDFSIREELDHSRRDSLPNSPTYRAPETDLAPEDSSITSSYDIWTLGCVFLEFLTWWLGGWVFVEHFATRRTEQDPSWYGTSGGLFRTDFFFTIVEDREGKKTAKVRKGVTDFMQDLYSHDKVKSNTFAHEFIDMIQKKMLIVESHKANGTKNGRASAKSIARDLESMRKHL